MAPVKKVSKSSKDRLLSQEWYLATWAFPALSDGGFGQRLYVRVCDRGSSFWVKLCRNSDSS